MPISFVGSHVLSTTNGGNVSLLFSALLDEAGGTPTVQEGDLAIVASVVSNSADFDMATSSSGWTEQHEVYVNGSSSDTNFAVYTKFMGPSPDANFAVLGNGQASSATLGVLLVLRGVDPTTPLDVAIAAANGTGTSRPNPASITPVTPGAWIVVLGGGAAGTGAAYTNPGDLSAVANHFRSLNRTETVDGMVGMGLKTDWASGAFDPAQWGGGSNVAGDSWAAATLALRPLAAPTGGKVKVRIGGAWVEKPVKVRLGGAWVEKPLKVRDGGVWELA